jgi:hypothetical protein
MLQKLLFFIILHSNLFKFYMRTPDDSRVTLPTTNPTFDKALVTLRCKLVCLTLTTSYLCPKVTVYS